MSFTIASLELKNSVNFSSRRILALFDSSVIGGNPKGVSGVLRGYRSAKGFVDDEQKVFRFPPLTVPNCHSHCSSH